MTPSDEHRTERIFAERVSAHTETVTPEFEVHSVSFGFTSADGERVLSVQRSFDDDDGVCLVLSPSQQCNYDPFTELRLTRKTLSMRFSPSGASVFGVTSLVIDFELPDDVWHAVSRTLALICTGKEFYVALDVG